jgi:signal transduction histidine kinase
MGAGTGRNLVGLGLGAVAFAAPAHAASFPEISPDLYPLAAAGLALAVFATLIFAVLRFSRREKSARRKLGDLEVRLNEAEAALAAETHVLLIWRGREAEPERMVGNMHGTVRVPPEVSGLLDFREWLEHDSAEAIANALSSLRSSGAAFNIGVRSKNNELLEADGRAAGGYATLRFRPLSGERREVTELASDAYKLGKQVERLSAVLDAAPQPIWLRGQNGKLVWVNQAYVRAVDAPDSNSVLKSGLEIASDGKVDRTFAKPADALLGRAHAVISGAMRALNIYEIALPDAMAGFAVDMSALEEAEKELDRHIKAHASTLDKLDTAIAIFGPDQRLRFYNTAYVKLWDIDTAVLDQHPEDGEILDRLRARRLLPEQANYREWKARQLSAYTTLEMRESWWYLPDGRSLHVVCEQHPFGGVTYLYENATKEIQLESRYNELISVQRETLDNLEEGVALFGSDGQLKLFNPAFAQFWSLDVAFLEQGPRADDIAARGRFNDAEATAWEEIRYGVTRLDTERKPIYGKITAADRILQYETVPLPDGNTLLTFSDISASARMERALRDRADALEAADRLKNNFLSNVSYEIRTPLTSVLGFAEGLQLGIAGPLTSKQKEYVVDIRKSSEELKSIIDAIIDLSAIDAGAMELKLEQVDVSELLQSVAERLSPVIEQRDQLLNIEVSDDAGSIIADPLRVGQVLTNLLSNAIGFSAPGGTIRMGARRVGASLQLWVSDSGRGIDPEFQKRAFDRFQSRPIPGGHRGPGLGLAIVKSFVELHEGSVSLLSKPNQGTTVLCSLPIEGPRLTRPGAHEPQSRLQA